MQYDIDKTIFGMSDEQILQKNASKKKGKKRGKKKKSKIDDLEDAAKAEGDANAKRMKDYYENHKNGPGTVKLNQYDIDLLE